MKIGFLVLMVSSPLGAKDCENHKKLQPFEIIFIYFILKHHFRLLYFISVVPYENGDSLCEIPPPSDK